MIKPEKKFMEAAIEEAHNAKNEGDYSIGAVIVKDGNIIIRATNRAKIDNDSTQHAEMVAIREASKILGTRFLEECILYTTHEPCPHVCLRCYLGPNERNSFWVYSKRHD